MRQTRRRGQLAGALPLAGCDAITGLMGGEDGSQAYAAGEASLRSGDLPAAADQWEQAAVEHPGDVQVASGAAYTLLLKGDTDAADAALAAAEATAGPDLPKLKMRRALVALEAGHLDMVGEHAKASGLPVGLLLAAEVAMAHAAKRLKDGAFDPVFTEADLTGWMGKAIDMVRSRAIYLVHPLISACALRISYRCHHLVPRQMM